MMTISPRRALRAATLMAGLMAPLSHAHADGAHGAHGQIGQITPSQAHAPIGVMGDHRHKAGEYMVSLRQMSMSMEGNIKGTQELSDTDVLAEANEYAAGQTLALSDAAWLRLL